MKKILWRIVAIFASIMPKKDIISFESNSDFCDSSRALYDLCLERKINKKYKIVWYVDNPEKFKDYNEYNVIFIGKHEKSIRRLYYKIFSKYCFYTHKFIGLQYNRGQIRYFLNHSSFPIKNLKGYYWNYRYNTYIEVTSDISAKYRAIALDGGLDRMKKLGLPRNDKLFCNDEMVLKNLNIDKYNKVIVWLPTFKHQNNTNRNDFGESSDNDMSILNYENFLDINRCLKENNIVLIVKFHPSQDMKYIKTFELSNILFLTNKDLDSRNVNLYELLGKSDALITDFSSVYFDYLLIDKPIGFELSDKEKYSKGLGFSVENPLDFMPGEKIYTFKDLEKFIKDVGCGLDKYRGERKELMNLIHDYKDGNSSERILKEVGILK